jgi:hypothetical protein
MRTSLGVFRLDYGADLGGHSTDNEWPELHKLSERGGFHENMVVDNEAENQPR